MLVFRAPTARHQRRPSDAFQAKLFSEIAQDFNGLRYSPLISEADRKAERIYRSALRLIAAEGDAGTLEKLFFAPGLDGARAVEEACPELIAAARRAVRTQRALQAAGLNEAAGVYPWYVVGLGDGGRR